jgi:hypothetical protein
MLNFNGDTFSKIGGSVGDPHFGADPDPSPDPTPDLTLFFSDCKDAKQIKFVSFFSYNLHAGTLSSVLKI